jgi:hypothetical protein
LWKSTGDDACNYVIVVLEIKNEESEVDFFLSISSLPESWAKELNRFSDK